MMKGLMCCISALKNLSAANDSVMEEDGNIYHYRDSRLVGITLPVVSHKNLGTRLTIHF